MCSKVEEISILLWVAYVGVACKPNFQDKCKILGKDECSFREYIYVVQTRHAIQTTHEVIFLGYSIWFSKYFPKFYFAVSLYFYDESSFRLINLRL